MVLATASVVVVLLLLEVLLRVFQVQWPDPLSRGGNGRLLAASPVQLGCLPDPELGWVLPPSADGIFPSGIHPIRLRTNGLGLRAEPPPFTGRPRVLVLGDSYLFGWGVPRDIMATTQLEARLRSVYPGAQVINACVPGYGLGQALTQWKRVAGAVDPDLVLVSLSLANDGADELRYRRFLQDPEAGYHAGPRDPGSAFSRAIRASRVLSWLDDHTLALQLNLQGAGPAATNLMESRIRELAAAVSPRPLVLLLLPRQAEVEPTGARGLLVPVFTRSARRMATKAGTEEWVARVIDVTPALRRGRGSLDLFLAGDSHWGAAGNRVVADTLAQALLEGLMPAPGP